MVNFTFVMHGNKLGIAGQTARQSPQLVEYFKRHNLSFEYDPVLDFWFFYPPEKYGAGDLHAGNLKKEKTCSRL